ncbi:trypco2 family protein [Streptomyces lasalocidi]
MIELSEMIQQLRQELSASLADGDGQLVRFELGPVEIEATVEVTREAGGSGKIRLLVAETGAEGKATRTRGQRITLTLHPKTYGVDGTPRTPLIAGSEVAGER